MGFQDLNKLLIEMFVVLNLQDKLAFESKEVQAVTLNKTLQQNI